VNILDKTVSYFSPKLGLQRARARAATEVLLRYEGARPTRNSEGWIATGSGANVEVGGDMSRLRNRVRDLVRNNSHCRKALRIWSTNVVGTGIMPRANTGDKKLDAIIDANFKTWAKTCDADGQLDFFGLQALIARTERMSGECLVRYRINSSVKTGSPLELQLLEPDFIDATKQFFPDPTGNYCILGVRFNQRGKRIGYWLYNRHPGELIVQNLKTFISQLVSAEEIQHIYYKERPGQVRGVPDFSTIITKLRDLGDYADAELVRKKIEACLAAFVESPDGADAPPLGQTTLSPKGQRIEEFSPGMVAYTNPGEKVTLNNPVASGGYRDYKTTELHEIAAGAGVMYEQISGDISQVNYSSYRAGHLEFRGDVEQYRWLLFIPMAMTPIWNRFIDTLVIAGEIPEANYGVKWTPPTFQSIDPEKDANAQEKKVRGGTLTLPEAVAEEGHDFEEQMAEIAATNKRLDELKILLTTDPRNFDNRGMLHGAAAEETGETPIPDKQ
jgi:lambda family phage portal protein